jgi:hypothetical protein
MEKSHQNKLGRGQSYRRSSAVTRYRTAAPPLFRCTIAETLAKPATYEPKTDPTNPPQSHFLLTKSRNTKFTERTHRRFSQPISPLVRSHRQPIIPPQPIPPTHLRPPNPRQKCPNSDPFRTSPATPSPQNRNSPNEPQPASTAPTIRLTAASSPML